LRKWALELSSILGEQVSHQALDKKLSIRHIGFVKELFNQAIRESLGFNTFSEIEVLKKFNRVLVEDSTCVKLSKNLYYHFSGVSNGLSKSTNARIQLSIDIKDCTFENVNLSTYSKNDSSFSENILNRLQPSDLVIRDLGYWKHSTFIKIDKADCFFISKLRSNTKLYEPIDNEDFSLIEKLEELDQNKIRSFDFNCRFNTKMKKYFRIVGRKLSQEEIETKRKKVVQSRHKDCKISPKSQYLLSWNIYITNIEKQELTKENIYELYRLRWHIEMIFKNWKSNFAISELLASSVGKCPVKVEMKMYLSLLYIVMIYQPTFNSFSYHIFEKTKKILSPLKYGQYINDNIKVLIKYGCENIWDDITKHCCYDKRKDRRNYYEYRYLIKLG